MTSILCLCFALFTLNAYAQSPAVLTQRGDIGRSGVQSNEKILTHENVAKNFGKLFELPVEGEIYAQPLYVPNVALPTGPKNLVIVASLKNYIYAFDADKAPPNRRRPYLWRTNLAVQNLDPHEGPKVEGFEGVLSTPVIDPVAGVIYAVSMDIPDHDAKYKIVKLSLTTGKVLAERAIEGHLPGTGPDAKVIDGISQVVFNPNVQLQRAGLLLHKGFVHVGFGAVGISTPYHGWFFSFKADDLSGGPSFITTPHEVKHGGGGIWQSGQGPSVDEKGFVYISTGNGDFSKEHEDFGNTLLKLDFNPRTGKFSRVDFFTPVNQQQLADLDWDFGAGGLLLVPPRYAVAVGKPGKFYVLDQENLGGYTPEKFYDAGAIQIFQVTEPSWRKIINNTIMWNIHGAPIQWQGRVYVMGESDPVKAYRMDLSTGRFDEKPFSSSDFVAPIGMPGGFVTLSVNAEQPAGTEILWVTYHQEGDATFEERPGILRALDANDLKRELWNSDKKRSDKVGLFAKFVHPTVANGRVYLGTFSNKVVVYGLR